MKNILVWGAGRYAEYVVSVIDKDSCMIKGMIDSDKNKQGRLWNGEIMIYSPEQILELEYDYIIISALNYEIIENKCKEFGIQKKVIAYFKDNEGSGIFGNRALQILNEQQKAIIYKNRLDSAPWEWGLKPIPKIESPEKVLIKMIRDKSSLCRFGDGEFKIMSGVDCSWFQKKSDSLRQRLIEVINSNDSNNINIAIAQNFTKFEYYKEEAADMIRNYMSYETRSAIIKFLDLNRTYYDAYVTRPYLKYKDRKNADLIFPLFKKIWQNRNVLIVEGKYARSGCGNDLYKNAKSIRRIICPYKNAWENYNDIFVSILQHINRDDIVCISLGPAATVLAYDIAKEGIQAIDIGQLDCEYDWYQNGAKERTELPGKMVAEASGNRDVRAEVLEKEKYNNYEYELQIIEEIKSI